MDDDEICFDIKPWCHSSDLQSPFNSQNLSQSLFSVKDKLRRSLLGSLKLVPVLAATSVSVDGPVRVDTVDQHIRVTSEIHLPNRALGLRESQMTQLLSCPETSCQPAERPCRDPLSRSSDDEDCDDDDEDDEDCDDEEDDDDEDDDDDDEECDEEEEQAVVKEQSSEQCWEYRKTSPPVEQRKCRAETETKPVKDCEKPKDLPIKIKDKPKPSPPEIGAKCEVKEKEPCPNDEVDDDLGDLHEECQYLSKEELKKICEKYKLYDKKAKVSRSHEDIQFGDCDDQSDVSKNGTKKSRKEKEKKQLDDDDSCEEDAVVESKCDKNKSREDECEEFEEEEKEPYYGLARACEAAPITWEKLKKECTPEPEPQISPRDYSRYDSCDCQEQEFFYKGETKRSPKSKNSGREPRKNVEMPCPETVGDRRQDKAVSQLDLYSQNACDVLYFDDKCKEEQKSPKKVKKKRQTQNCDKLLKNNEEMVYFGSSPKEGGELVHKEAPGERTGTQLCPHMYYNAGSSKCNVNNNGNDGGTEEVDYFWYGKEGNKNNANKGNDSGDYLSSGDDTKRCFLEQPRCSHFCGDTGRFASQLGRSQCTSNLVAGYQLESVHCPGTTDNQGKYLAYGHSSQDDTGGGYFNSVISTSTRLEACENATSDDGFLDVAPLYTENQRKNLRPVLCDVFAPEPTESSVLTSSTFERCRSIFESMKQRAFGDDFEDYFEFTDDYQEGEQVSIETEHSVVAGADANPDAAADKAKDGSFMSNWLGVIDNTDKTKTTGQEEFVNLGTESIVVRNVDEPAQVRMTETSENKKHFTFGRYNDRCAVRVLDKDLLLLIQTAKKKKELETRRGNKPKFHFTKITNEATDPHAKVIAVPLVENSVDFRKRLTTSSQEDSDLEVKNTGYIVKCGKHPKKEPGTSLLDNDPGTTISTYYLDTGSNISVEPNGCLCLKTYRDKVTTDDVLISTNLEEKNGAVVDENNHDANIIEAKPEEKLNNMVQLEEKHEEGLVRRATDSVETNVLNEIKDTATNSIAPNQGKENNCDFVVVSHKEQFGATCVRIGQGLNSLPQGSEVKNISDNVASPNVCPKGGLSLTMGEAGRPTLNQEYQQVLSHLTDGTAALACIGVQATPQAEEQHKLQSQSASQLNSQSIRVPHKISQNGTRKLGQEHCQSKPSVVNVAGLGVHKGRRDKNSRPSTPSVQREKRLWCSASRRGSPSNKSNGTASAFLTRTASLTNSSVQPNLSSKPARGQPAKNTVDGKIKSPTQLLAFRGPMPIILECSHHPSPSTQIPVQVEFSRPGSSRPSGYRLTKRTMLERDVTYRRCVSPCSHWEVKSISSRPIRPRSPSWPQETSPHNRVSFNRQWAFINRNNNGSYHTEETFRDNSDIQNGNSVSFSENSQQHEASLAIDLVDMEPVPEMPTFLPQEPSDKWATDSLVSHELSSQLTIDNFMTQREMSHQMASDTFLQDDLPHAKATSVAFSDASNILKNVRNFMDSVDLQPRSWVGNDEQASLRQAGDTEFVGQSAEASCVNDVDSQKGSRFNDSSCPSLRAEVGYDDVAAAPGNDKYNGLALKLSTITSEENAALSSIAPAVAPCSTLDVPTILDARDDPSTTPIETGQALGSSHEMDISFQKVNQRAVNKFTFMKPGRFLDEQVMQCANVNALTQEGDSSNEMEDLGIDMFFGGRAYKGTHGYSATEEEMPTDGYIEFKESSNKVQLPGDFAYTAVSCYEPSVHEGDQGQLAGDKGSASWRRSGTYTDNINGCWSAVATSNGSGTNCYSPAWKAAGVKMDSFVEGDRGGFRRENDCSNFTYSPMWKEESTRNYNESRDNPDVVPSRDCWTRTSYTSSTVDDQKVDTYVPSWKPNSWARGEDVVTCLEEGTEVDGWGGPVFSASRKGAKVWNTDYEDVSNKSGDNWTLTAASPVKAKGAAWKMVDVGGEEDGEKDCWSNTVYSPTRLGRKPWKALDVVVGDDLESHRESHSPTKAVSVLSKFDVVNRKLGEQLENQKEATPLVILPSSIRNIQVPHKVKTGRIDYSKEKSPGIASFSKMGDGANKLKSSNSEKEAKKHPKPVSSVPCPSESRNSNATESAQKKTDLWNGATPVKKDARNTKLATVETRIEPQVSTTNSALSGEEKEGSTPQTIDSKIGQEDNSASVLKADNRLNPAIIEGKSSEEKKYKQWPSHFAGFRFTPMARPLTGGNAGKVQESATREVVASPDRADAKTATQQEPDAQLATDQRPAARPEPTKMLSPPKDNTRNVPSDRHQPKEKISAHSSGNTSGHQVAVTREGYKEFISKEKKKEGLKSGHVAAKLELETVETKNALNSSRHKSEPAVDIKRYLKESSKKEKAGDGLRKPSGTSVDYKRELRRDVPLHSRRMISSTPLTNAPSVNTRQEPKTTNRTKKPNKSEIGSSFQDAATVGTKAVETLNKSNRPRVGAPSAGDDDHVIYVCSSVCSVNIPTDKKWKQWETQTRTPGKGVIRFPNFFPSKTEGPEKKIQGEKAEKIHPEKADKLQPDKAEKTLRENAEKTQREKSEKIKHDKADKMHERKADKNQQERVEEIQTEKTEKPHLTEKLQTHNKHGGTRDQRQAPHDNQMPSSLSASNQETQLTTSDFASTIRGELRKISPNIAALFPPRVKLSADGKKVIGQARAAKNANAVPAKSQEVAPEPKPVEPIKTCEAPKKRVFKIDLKEDHKPYERKKTTSVVTKQKASRAALEPASKQHKVYVRDRSEGSADHPKRSSNFYVSTIKGDPSGPKEILADNAIKTKRIFKIDMDEEVGSKARGRSKINVTKQTRPDDTKSLADESQKTTHELSTKSTQADGVNVEKRKPISERYQPRRKLPRTLGTGDGRVEYSKSEIITARHSASGTLTDGEDNKRCNPDRQEERKKSKEIGKGKIAPELAKLPNLRTAQIAARDPNNSKGSSKAAAAGSFPPGDGAHLEVSQATGDNLSKVALGESSVDQVEAPKHQPTGHQSTVAIRADTAAQKGRRSREVPRRPLSTIQSAPEVKVEKLASAPLVGSVLETVARAWEQESGQEARTMSPLTVVQTNGQSTAACNVLDTSATGDAEESSQSELPGDYIELYPRPTILPSRKLSSLEADVVGRTLSLYPASPDRSEHANRSDKSSPGRSEYIAAKFNKTGTGKFEYKTEDAKGSTNKGAALKSEIVPVPARRPSHERLAAGEKRKIENNREERSQHTLDKLPVSGNKHVKAQCDIQKNVINKRQRSGEALSLAQNQITAKLEGNFSRFGDALIPCQNVLVGGSHQQSRQDAQPRPLQQERNSGYGTKAGGEITRSSNMFDPARLLRPGPLPISSNYGTKAIKGPGDTWDKAGRGYMSSYKVSSKGSRSEIIKATPNKQPDVKASKEARPSKEEVAASKPPPLLAPTVEKAPEVSKEKPDGGKSEAAEVQPPKLGFFARILNTLTRSSQPRTVAAKEDTTNKQESNKVGLEDPCSDPVSLEKSSKLVAASKNKTLRNRSPHLSGRDAKNLRPDYKQNVNANALDGCIDEDEPVKETEQPLVSRIDRLDQLDSTTHACFCEPTSRAEAIKVQAASPKDLKVKQATSWIHWTGLGLLPVLVICTYLRLVPGAWEGCLWWLVQPAQVWTVHVQSRRPCFHHQTMLLPASLTAALLELTTKMYLYLWGFLRCLQQCACTVGKILLGTYTVVEETEGHLPYQNTCPVITSCARKTRQVVVDPSLRLNMRQNPALHTTDSSQC